MKKSFLLGAVCLFIGLLSVPKISVAQSEVEELQKQIEALQNRVQELEAAQQHEPQRSGRSHDSFFGGDWDPFAEMEQMQQDMQGLFNNFPPIGSHPSSKSIIINNNSVMQQDLEMTEEDGQYVVRINTSGLDQEKIDVQVNAHSITLSGEYSQSQESDSLNQNFYSYSSGSFMKTIPLPVDADVDQMSSEHKGEELIITIPKKSS